MYDEFPIFLMETNANFEAMLGAYGIIVEESSPSLFPKQHDAPSDFLAPFL